MIPRPRPSRAALGLLALLALAVGLRLWRLGTIPILTDEADDVLYSLPIALGGPIPTTNFDTFNGSLYNVVLALALRTGGFDSSVPRLVSAAGSSLAVAAAYALGRTCGGPIGGLVTAALLATAPADVLNGRVSYSNAWTPLFATLALGLLSSALARRSGSRLAAAGLVGGLAVQTHASAIGLLPGALVAVALARDWPRRFAWYALAGAGALAAEWPVVAYNAATDFESVTYALRHRQPVDQLAPLTPTRYLDNLGLVAAAFARALSGFVTDRYQSEVALSHPAVLAAIWLGAVGLAALVARRRWALVLPALTFGLTQPLLNSHYDPPLPLARYVLPVLPVVFAGLGLLTTAAWARWRSPPARRSLVAAVTLLAAAPLVPLASYVSAADEAHDTGAAVLGAVDLLASRPNTRSVVLDEGLYGQYTLGGGRLLKSFEALLSLRNVPYTVASVGNLPTLPPPGQAQLAVLLPRTAAALDRRTGPARVDLAAVLPPPASTRPYEQFGVYRLSRPPSTDPGGAGPPPCRPALEAPADLAGPGCFTGRVERWTAGADDRPTIAALGPGLLLSITPAARAASPALRELDRVQRPVGRRLAVRGEVVAAPDGRGWQIPVERPDQLTFLPIRD